MGTHTCVISRAGTNASDTSTAATFAWQVGAGSGTNPVNAADFPGGTFPSGTGTVAAGAASATITFQSNPDATFEPDETGVLTVTTTQNGVTITGSPQPFTITNDDADPGGGTAPASYGPQTVQSTPTFQTNSTAQRAGFDYTAGKLVASMLFGLDAAGQNAYICVRQLNDGLCYLAVYDNGTFTTVGNTNKPTGFDSNGLPFYYQLNASGSIDLYRNGVLIPENANGGGWTAAVVASAAGSRTRGTYCRVQSDTSGQTLTNARIAGL